MGCYICIYESWFIRVPSVFDENLFEQLVWQLRNGMRRQRIGVLIAAALSRGNRIKRAGAAWSEDAQWHFGRLERMEVSLVGESLRGTYLNTRVDQHRLCAKSATDLTLSFGSSVTS